MRQAFALASLLALVGAGPGCATAVRHPVPTLGLVGGTIGFGTCEMDQVSIGTCGVIAASTAVFMGGVAAIVYLLTDQPTPQMDGEEVEQPLHRRPRMLPPEPEPDAAPVAPPALGSDSGAGAAGSGSAAGSGAGT